ncbi:MAG: tRNA epoxyqueuosine(34) reductase QueG [Gammaproteobacteria bacterium]|nr:tRNA epoxyqueuosine(34) reductase QueG [Gammaproteobacteria bacterium]
MNDPLNRKSGHADIQWATLAQDIQRWGAELGFQKVGFSDTRLDRAEAQLLNWLQLGYHGRMEYMSRHGHKRSRPAELEPGTVSVISARMDYLPATGDSPESVLNNPHKAYISRYALGRDYHKVLRQRLQKLATRIEQAIGEFGYRVFTDSAPVLEKAIAEKAGLGWIGKHSNLLAEHTGSWFFLGEIYTDLPLPSSLPTDTTATNHCGTCTACIEACPTRAIVAPYQVDARLCISYLTIELREAIPVALRPLLGNRIYGCDDCQLTCPWNRFAQPSPETDFLPRHALDSASLIELFQWSEEEFLRRTEGSPIRRIGHHCWLRNIAVALGNAPTTDAVIEALNRRHQHDSALVREHVQWALDQHQTRAQGASEAINVVQDAG